MADSNPARTKYRPLLSAYVDGELSTAERREVEQHLAHNPASAQEVADLRAASGLTRLALELEADDVDWKAFTADVLGKVAPQRLPFWEGLRLSFQEALQYQRGPLVAGLVGATLALVAVIPLLLAQRGTGEGYASTQLVVQQVTVDEDADVQPVVMETDSGDAIIWLVPPTQARPKKDGGKKDDESAEEELMRAAPPSPTAEPL